MKRLLSCVLLMCVFFCGFTCFGEENNIIEYIDGIRNAYKTLANEYGFLYHVGSELESTFHERNVIAADIVIDAYTSYSFDMWIDGGSKFGLWPIFSMDSNDTEDKSFIIHCENDEVSEKIIKELILATLYVIDDDMDNEKAQAMLKQFVNTYNGKNHSYVYSNEDYYMFVSYGKSSGGDESTIINVVDKRRIILTDDEKINYTNMTYDEICAPLNAGELVCFEGVPVKRIENNSSDWLDVGREYWNVKVPDGQVRIEFSFDTYPISLELDKSYIFYGMILRGENTGEGIIRIDCAEEKNDGTNVENIAASFINQVIGAVIDTYNSADMEG